MFQTELRPPKPTPRFFKPDLIQDLQNPSNIKWITANLNYPVFTELQRPVSITIPQAASSQCAESPSKYGKFLHLHHQVIAAEEKTNTVFSSAISRSLCGRVPQLKD